MNEAPPSGQPSQSNQPSSTSQLEESGIEVDFDAPGPSGTSGACSAPTWSSVVPKRLSEEVNDNIFRVDSCDPEDMRSQRSAEERADLLRLKQKKRRILNDPKYDDFPWSSNQCKGHLWQSQINQYQKIGCLQMYVRITILGSTSSSMRIIQGRAHTIAEFVQ